jgi:predicted HicB family RNase H-like nuclease
MPKGKPREATNIRLDPDLKAEAIQLAEAQGKKLNNVIETLLAGWVKRVKAALGAAEE